MPVSVSLQFVLPAEPNIATLRIWECATPDGTFQLIDSTSEVGSYPNYITYFTTAEATAEDYWFAINWIDSEGAESDLSEPWQGGVDSIVNQVADRVAQRDSSLPVPVVIQESEATIERYFGQDPYEVTEEDLGSRKYQILSGLTYLVLARSLIVRLVQTTSLSDLSSVTLGLVTMRTGGGSSSSVETNLAQIKGLIDMANRELGLSTSVVAQIEEITNDYGQRVSGPTLWVLQ